MTLVLVCANRDQSILLSDRRLTAAGAVVDEECNKSGTVEFRNGRLAFGFTGIARTLSLEVRRWLLDALLEAGPPDYTAHATLERFKAIATRDFRAHSVLRRISPEDKRFGVVFVGYIHNSIPPNIGAAFISNFSNYETEEFSQVAFPEFGSQYKSESRPRGDNPTFIERIGAIGTVSNANTGELRRFIEERKPADAIINKGIEVLLSAADSASAGGTVGRQITWICVPADRRLPSKSGYYSSVSSKSVYIPSFISLVGADGIAMDTASVSVLDPRARPLAVPKVHSKAPCPCGSGKKYKHCHGK